MTKDKIDDLIDIIGEKYAEIENTFVIRNNQQLFKYLENPSAWKKRQLSTRLSYKKEIIANARKFLTDLNEKTEKVFLLTYKEIDKDLIKVTENEIVAENLPKSVINQIKKLKEFNSKEVLKLANQSFKTYSKQVQIISRVKSTDDLYDAIKKQVPKGVENGIKVAYKDGKNFSWKSYMEMNVRTTIHQEAVNIQIDAGTRIGQVFYICNSFGDCAPDHANYQGKIYYNADANIGEEEQKYIDQNGIMSMQDVVNNEPFLTSRPNCRHEFSAIPTEDVLKMSSEEILKENGLKFGEYKGSNYEALQKQRYNERQIRKWKLQEENAKKLISQTGVNDVANVNSAHKKVLDWQKRQRELISENADVLKRQRERENAKIIVNDLGVRYKYKLEDGELVKRK